MEAVPGWGPLFLVALVVLGLQAQPPASLLPRQVSQEASLIISAPLSTG